MRPILFDKNATVFTTNGIGRLMPISCEVTEERNGRFELETVVKIGCNHYEDIKHSAIIVAKPSPKRNPQAFRIYKVSKPINGRVKVKAEHIGYQLNYIPVRVFSAQGVKNALNGFVSNALEACPFRFETDLDSTASYSIALPESIRHYLGGVRGSILDVYGGEYEWDNYTVKLHKSRGHNYGVVLNYGKNITDLQQEENIQNTYTGIFPYWQSEETMVTLPEPVRSSNASNFPFNRTIVKDFSDQFNDVPTQAQLLSAAQSYIEKNGIGVPSVSVTVSFVDLAQTEEYKDVLALQDVELCDTITVRFLELGVDANAKVTKTVYDVLSERYVTIGVGNVRSNLARTIEDQISAMDYTASIDDTKRSIDRATGVLNAGRKGHFIIGRNAEGWSNEAIFVDNENIASALRTLRINMNGIGFSSNGINGPYYQSWTMDGHFSLGGLNNAYGVFHILDGNGVEIGRWDKDGINAVGGKFSGNIEGSKITGSSFGTKSDAFYVLEEEHDGSMRPVIGLGGWTSEDNVIYSNWIGDNENPATNDTSVAGDVAAMNGDTGDAGFRRLYLLDGDRTRNVGDILSDYGRRIKALEDNSGGDPNPTQGGQGGGSGEDLPGNGEGPVNP